MASVRNLYQRFRIFVAGLWRKSEPPPGPTIGLIPELARFFFSDLIDAQPEDVRGEWHSEYADRLEEAIKQELKNWPEPKPPYFVRLEKELPELTLSGVLSEEACKFPEGLLDLMRKRGNPLLDQLTLPPLSRIREVFLTALQQVTLDIVRRDYTAIDTGIEVPSTVRVALRKTLQQIDRLSRDVKSPVRLKTHSKADIALRILMARAGRTVCLPLRPIPTSPLENEELLHYKGREDGDALKLARQIRQADGAILVTGYRGVGKSSFVNRVKFHALTLQNDLPQDEWLIVPVTVNLAKVSGVQNILRLTLRAVRDGLLDRGSDNARMIPGSNSGKLQNIPLPLSLENEILPLQEAYIRATYKVTLSRVNASEKKWEAGSSFSFDPGKLLAPLTGLQLGKFLEAGFRKTRTEKINRELNLLDYDENSAEDDLIKLIRSLATLRPLHGAHGPDVRIKLVFIFDELDKMDVEHGLKPMIEGLKNLFLQQYSVFVLVTSKKFYYELLKDRAIEDAMLNSYFSAIVHVPLLSFAQAKDMVKDWIDKNAFEQLEPLAPEESKLIDQLTRWLVYKSYGNPRDIIRELRVMQQWADTTEQPYLTDGLGKSLQIFAAIQEKIEQAAVSQQSTAGSTSSEGGVALASQRLAGDQARFEQIQRGLYILTEELINRQTLTLEDRPEPVDDKKPPNEDAVLAAPETPLWTNQVVEILGKLNKPTSTTPEQSALARIQKDNFSLLSLRDVQDLAKQLGLSLCDVHNVTDLFSSPDWGSRRPLFEIRSDQLQLRVTNDFYALTGLQAIAASSPSMLTATPTQKSADELLIEAEKLAEQEEWVKQLRAIGLLKQASPSQPSEKLVQFLLRVTREDSDPEHRMIAAEQLTPAMIFGNEQLLRDLFAKQHNERVLAVLLRLLSRAPNDTARQWATHVILELLKLDQVAIYEVLQRDPFAWRDRIAEVRRLTDGNAISALTGLQTVAHRDVSFELLAWLCVAGTNDLVRTAAVRTFEALASKFHVDLAHKIIDNRDALLLFTTGSTKPWTNVRSAESDLKTYLRGLLRNQPLDYAAPLFRVYPDVEVNDLLTHIWDLAYERSRISLPKSFGQTSEPESLRAEAKALSVHVFDLLYDAEQSGLTPLVKSRLIPSLQATTEFRARMLPYLRSQSNELLKSGIYQPEEAARLAEFMRQLEFEPPTPPVSERSSRSSESTNQDELRRHFRKRLLVIGASILVFSLSTFGAGLFFYRRDLPAAATTTQLLVSRLLILILDSAILSPVIAIIQGATLRARRSTWGSKALSQRQRKNLVMMVLLIFALGTGAYFLHIHNIGPLHLWNQVIQFFINLPVLFFTLILIFATHSWWSEK